MPCHAAMVKKPVTAKPDQSVEKVIELLEKQKISAAPIIDKDGVLQGVFSMKTLLKNLVPVSVAMVNGIQIDLKVNAAPGVAKRLSQIKPLPVSEIMDRKPLTVKPDAPLWEAVSTLTSHGGSLLVVDDKMKFLGLITYSSLVEALEKLADGGE